MRLVRTSRAMNDWRVGQCCSKVLRRALGSSSDSNSNVDPTISSFLSTRIQTADLPEQAQQQLYIKLVQSLEPIYGKNNVKVSHLEAFGTSGLQELANAIVRDDETMNHSDTAHPYVTVRFSIPHHKTEFNLPWYYTKSQSATLLDLVKDPAGAQVLSEYLEAACGGNASCSTCHVYLDANTATACGIELSDVSEAELDMLDYAFQANETSRLACQVRVQRQITLNSKMTMESNGASLPKLEVVIPSDANNLWK
jgi:ferredoxin